MILLSREDYYKMQTVCGGACMVATQILSKGGSKKPCLQFFMFKPFQIIFADYPRVFRVEVLVYNF
jgi:hypothetical protein